MSNEKSQGKSEQGKGGQGQAPGQQKSHEVTNPATGVTTTVTQEQWRNRKTDPALDGFERVEADEQAEEPPA